MLQILSCIFLDCLGRCSVRFTGFQLSYGIRQLRHPGVQPSGRRTDVKWLRLILLKRLIHFLFPNGGIIMLALLLYIDITGAGGKCGSRSAKKLGGGELGLILHGFQ